MADLRELLADEYGDELLFMDGYDDCIAGVVERYDMAPVVAYSKQKVIRKLVDQGMNYEDAEDFYGYNQIGAWVGEMTPAFVTLFSERAYG